MNNKIKIIVIALLSVLNLGFLNAKNVVDLILIPPSKVSSKVNLDIRGGIVNKDMQSREYKVTLYWNKERKSNVIFQDKIFIPAGKSKLIKKVLSMADKVGKNKVIFKVETQGEVYRENKKIEVIKSDIRSLQQISGAWAGLYHWSEVEGKHWNPDIRKMTDEQWKELTNSMHKIEMNTMVIQEVFRNEEYKGKKPLDVNTYIGKAYYPTKLYPERMDITAKDPIEAILTEADKLDMNIFLGVGLFNWFDFSKESLEWHKRVVSELWSLYGHHKSFYGFYVSEESGGSLDNWLAGEEGIKRKKAIVDFFKKFKAYCNQFAPAKPIMLATNSFGVRQGADTYPALMENLDILCPFGFARMPEGDMTGKEAATMLQNICDKAGSHLWFDLETFLFNSDNSLYPRPIEQIINDLNLLDNFENILCYQFPGVFNDPKMSIRIGEERTITLFNGYVKYLKELKAKRK